VPDARLGQFVCYETLVVWSAGIQAELARLFGVEHAARLSLRCHELEPRVQSEDPRARYRDVIAAVLGEFASEAGRELAPGDKDALGRSLPAWPVFPEVPAWFEGARRRGWQLVILSGSDRDLIDASIGAIAVSFSAAIVTSEVGSDEPALGHWQAFYDVFGSHHAVACRRILGHLGFLNESIAALTEQIDQRTAAFAPVYTSLLPVPGFDWLSIDVIIAETGADMSRFPTPGDLASWVGLCPGSHESAGKRRRCGTTKGNPWLRRALIESARAAARTKGSYFGARYRRSPAAAARTRPPWPSPIRS